MAATLKLRRGTPSGSIQQSELFYDKDIETVVVGDGSGSNTQYKILAKLDESNSGSLNISGNITGSNILANNITATGDLTIGGNLFVGGTATIVGNTTMTANLGVGGTLDVVSNTSIGGTAKITGTTTITGNSGFLGTVRVSGATSLEGTAHITGTATITGNTGFLGTVRVSGNTSLEGQLQLTKSAAAVVCATAINGVTSVSLNFGNAQNFRTTVTAAHTLAKPTGCRSGQTGSIFLTQSGGSGTMAYNADFKFIGGTDPTLSTADGAVDRLDYIIVSASSDGVGGDIQMVISQAYA